MPPSAPVTAVIPTLNEAIQIADCVRAVRWADEIIVADGGSSDETPRAAAAAGAKVLQGSWRTIAAQRNAAIAAARNDWVLAVDADERVGPELAEEIGATVGAPEHRAYAVRRANSYAGRTIRFGGWGDDWVVRLFRRDRRYVERRVHEHLEHGDDVGKLRAPLLHTPYRDLSHYVEKLDRYATWGAEELAERGRRAHLVDVLLRPPARFFSMYILRLGFLDGWRGAVLSGLTGVSVFLKYVRLWELGRNSDG
ncbi:MAG TPA: glycosyltransferase family 2 protein [Gemmatimonadales bacterium]|nr:glycosyltransferase family 2 protein [Gemmatimonadales bacterium]